MTSSAAIIVHGGSSASHDDLSYLVQAARQGMAKARADALQGVIAAVESLENCGAFNAGAGADVRLDGQRLELDASVMDSRGVLGAVAGLSRTRNPVMAARAVARTPHWLLSGRGADQFAERAGLPQDAKPSSEALSRQRQLLKDLQAPQAGAAGVGSPHELLVQFWNYPTDWEYTIRAHGCGTVGAVARDADGTFAVASSTGGSAPCLWGRVGDTPIIGAGFYAGPAGAVGCTGIGEFIVRQMLAMKVYGWLEQELGLQEALDKGVGLFNKTVSVGLIGVTKNEIGQSSNRNMPTFWVVDG